MPLLRKNKPLIPPVSENKSVSSFSGRSNASTYVASRDGDLSSSRSASSTIASQDPYSSHDRSHRNASIGDVYSRGGGDVERDRNELFAGVDKTKVGSGRFFDGPGTGAADEDEDDVEGIKTQTRVLKQESVQSSRNALRLAQEAEETARSTLLRLGDQSEKLANTEQHLSVAKGHSARAEDKTDELKQLNRSIFRPVITFNKDAKRAAQEAKVVQRFEDERMEREKAMTDIRETQNRLGRAATYGRDDEDEDEDEGIRQKKTAQRLADSKDQRKRYQFEATASDDEIEDELDGNLEGISQATKSLKALGLAMGQELDQQNNRLRRIEDQTVALDSRIYRNTERLKRIK